RASGRARAAGLPRRCVSARPFTPPEFTSVAILARGSLARPRAPEVAAALSRPPPLSADARGGRGGWSPTLGYALARPVPGGWSDMSGIARRRILELGGVLLVVLGVLHLSVTPFISRFVRDSAAPGAAAWLEPPVLLDHVVVGILLLPL